MLTEALTAPASAGGVWRWSSMTGKARGRVLPDACAWGHTVGAGVRAEIALRRAVMAAHFPGTGERFRVALVDNHFRPS